VQSTGTIATLAVVSVLSGALVWLYNRLVRLRNLVRSSWSDIDVMLRKRHDRAMRAAGPAEKGPEEGTLGRSLSSLFAVAENYPELKASESFLALQKQLAELENGIEYARRYYNAVVRDYNSATETFPSTLVASLFGFAREEFFRLDSPAERERTDVRLS